MAGNFTKPSLLHVEVRNVKGDVVVNAKVTLHPKDSKVKAIPLGFDNRSASYIVEEVPTGTAQIEVKHEHLQSQIREVSIGASGGHELFILGECGARIYFREKVRASADAVFPKYRKMQPNQLMKLMA